MKMHKNERLKEGKLTNKTSWTLFCPLDAKCAGHVGLLAVAFNSNIFVFIKLSICST